MGGYPSVLVGSVSVCHIKINEQTYSRPRLRESTYHLGQFNCFKCLSSNHFARYCKSSCKCLITGCKGTFHHTLLHKNTDAEVTGHVDACSSVQLNKLTGNVQHVFLNIVPVRVRCEGKETEVYAFLDQGYTACFCDRSLARELQLSGTN